MSDEYYRVDLIKEALKNGASFFYHKPVQPCNIALLWQRLWPQVLSFPGRVTADDGNGKKRVLSNSDDGNGKRRKIPNAQDHVNFKGTL